MALSGSSYRCAGCSQPIPCVQTLWLPSPSSAPSLWGYPCCKPVSVTSVLPRFYGQVLQPCPTFVLLQCPHYLWHRGLCGTWQLSLKVKMCLRELQSSLRVWTTLLGMILCRASVIFVGPFQLSFFCVIPLPFCLLVHQCLPHLSTGQTSLSGHKFLLPAAPPAFSPPLCTCSCLLHQPG